MASIDDFKKLDLRVAQILEVREHPNADRLYVLKISLGDSERQIVAGIRTAYPNKEDLVGKRVVVVANLDPVVLRGEESQGMMLAASDEQGPTILSPARDVALGSLVK